MRGFLCFCCSSNPKATGCCWSRDKRYGGRERIEETASQARGNRSFPPRPNRRRLGRQVRYRKADSNQNHLATSGWCARAGGIRPAQRDHAEDAWHIAGTNLIFEVDHGDGFEVRAQVRDCLAPIFRNRAGWSWRRIMKSANDSQMSCSRVCSGQVGSGKAPASCADLSR